MRNPRRPLHALSGKTGEGPHIDISIFDQSGLAEAERVISGDSKIFSFNQDGVLSRLPSKSHNRIPESRKIAELIEKDDFLKRRLGSLEKYGNEDHFSKFEKDAVAAVIAITFERLIDLVGYQKAKSSIEVRATSRIEPADLYDDNPDFKKADEDEQQRIASLSGEEKWQYMAEHIDYLLDTVEYYDRVKKTIEPIETRPYSFDPSIIVREYRNPWGDFIDLGLKPYNLLSNCQALSRFNDEEFAELWRKHNVHTVPAEAMKLYKELKEMVFLFTTSPKAMVGIIENFVGFVNHEIYGLAATISIKIDPDMLALIRSNPNQASANASYAKPSLDTLAC
jgi:hypothetical protein